MVCWSGPFGPGWGFAAAGGPITADVAAGPTSAAAAAGPMPAAAAGFGTMSADVGGTIPSGAGTATTATAAMSANAAAAAAGTMSAVGAGTVAAVGTTLAGAGAAARFATFAAAAGSEPPLGSATKLSGGWSAPTSVPCSIGAMSPGRNAETAGALGTTTALSVWIFGAAVVLPVRFTATAFGAAVIGAAASVATAFGAASHCLSRRGGCAQMAQGLWCWLASIGHYLEVVKANGLLH